MSNFDEKFGPRPVHILDELRILGAQFLIVMILTYAIEPSFLNAPKTSMPSLTLTILFALMSVIVTVVVHSSFIVPS